MFRTGWRGWGRTKGEPCTTTVLTVHIVMYGIAKEKVILFVLSFAKLLGI